jgi:transposase
LSTNATATTIHRPDNCDKCGKDLSGAEVSGVIRRQVFDLPPVALFCTEHQAQRRRCRCGTETTGTFPADATAPACYGPALRAYVCYLVTRQHIPIARVAEQLRDTYGAPISTATIISMVKEGAAMLEEFLACVRDLLRDADVVHADETGLRVEAALAWVHAASTGDLALYHLDKARGTDAMDAMGVIEHLHGVLVHDGWSSYRSYDNLTYQLCNAHHLHELEANGIEAEDGLYKWVDYRQRVLDYLDDDSVSPLPFRQMADRDPTRASEVLRRVLGRKSSDWRRDGEKLMRQRKRSFFDRAPLPRILPFSTRLAPYVGSS